MRYTSLVRIPKVSRRDEESALSNLTFVAPSFASLGIRNHVKKIIFGGFFLPLTFAIPSIQNF